MTTSSGAPIPEYAAPPASGSPDAGTASTADVAKQQAGAVADTAADAGKHVANVAGDQAQQVAGEVKNQAQDLLGQTREELTTQATHQQQRVAGGLQALSDEFSSMADKSDKPGIATDLTRQASQHAHAVASWLEEREPGQILDEVTRFARRKPGTFLALAAGAGLIAGRLGRGITAANTSNENTSGPSPRTVSAPPRADVTPTAPLTPRQGPAAGYAAPPAGYPAGQHAADRAGSGGRVDSPYPATPSSAPLPGRRTPPAPGAAR